MANSADKGSPEEEAQRAWRELEEQQRKTAIEIAAILHQEVIDILETTRKHDARLTYDARTAVSPEKLLESVRYALRDFDRLEVDQRQEFSITKYVGYLGFWFGKLKPLSNVRLLAEGTGTGDSEVLDINEAIVIPLLWRMLLRMTRKTPSRVPLMWRDCTNAQCARAGDDKLGKCFFKKIEKFMSAFDGRLHEYLYYTLRYRPASPYILVAALDQAMFYSCEVTCPPLFTPLAPSAA